MEEIFKMYNNGNLILIFKFDDIIYLEVKVPSSSLTLLLLLSKLQIEMFIAAFHRLVVSTSKKIR